MSPVPMGLIRGSRRKHSIALQAHPIIGASTVGRGLVLDAGAEGNVRSNSSRDFRRPLSPRERGDHGHAFLKACRRQVPLVFHRPHPGKISNNHSWEKGVMSNLHLDVLQGDVFHPGAALDNRIGLDLVRDVENSPHVH